MSYACTTLGSVKRRLGAFEWYVFLLQDGLTDALRAEIEANFDGLGRIAGEDAVVIRGYDQRGFQREVREAYAAMYPRLGAVFPPALFVTDRHPAALDDPKAAAEGGQFMVFPLGAIADRGRVADFLSRLVDALQDADALAALRAEDGADDPGRFERKWQWLTQYLDIRPGFFGFGLKGTPLGTAAARQLDRWWPEKAGV